MSLPKPTTCQQCVGWGWGQSGYVPADGSGENGVLVVLEAAGEDEAEASVPTVGKAGQYLWSQLKRAGIERDGFRIHNVLSCRPPNNKLLKMAYEQSVISSCSPLLDATITDMQQRCRQSGKTFTILTLGKIAFKRILGLTDKSPILHEKYLCYPIWSERYHAWVVAADHPSFINRGNHHLVPVLQFAAKRALDIASNGYTYENPTYLLDPLPVHFEQWVEGYRRQLAADPDNTFLSFDIETPYKKGKDEEGLVSAEDESEVILRVSFAYEPSSAVSIHWAAHYMPAIRELFASEGMKMGWNSDEFDVPRIIKHMPINGVLLDGMVAWHILHAALPKGLGSVTPFYAPRFKMWKHLSDSQPAHYSAVDALAALRCWLGIQRDLKSNDQWHVYERHVLHLNKALTYMSNVGLMRDDERRGVAEVKLTDMLTTIDGEMAAAIPPEARTIDHIYVNTPKDTTGLLVRAGVRSIKTCANCGSEKPRKDHFTVYKKKLNPCGGAGVTVCDRPVDEYYRFLPWAASPVQLLKYQAARKHQAIKNREGKVTFDENALTRLQKKYPTDPLYKLIGRQRHLTKMLSTYIGRTQEDGTIKGGMPMGADNLGHPTFKHDPKTLRLSCSYFHQLPRPGKPDEPATWIRNTIVARPGHTFLARDFSGIEAVLVGYEAQSARYIRLAKMDVHSYYTAYSLHEYDKVGFPAADLPSLEWDDDKLSRHLAGIKSEFKQERNELYKHLTHALNFGQQAKGAQEKILKETERIQPLDKITRVMGVYKELFPEIPRWHTEVRLQADKDGYLKNAFGYVLRFNRVFAWEKVNGQWVRKLGDEAEEVLAFKPQSNAAGIIKEAIIRLFFDRFEEAGKYLRLQVHDENFTEPLVGDVDAVDAILQEEMERPIPQMPLPLEWGMGPYLTVLTEAKRGPYWGEMH